MAVILFPIIDVKVSHFPHKPCVVFRRISKKANISMYICMYNETEDIKARNFQSCHPKMEKGYSLGFIQSVTTSCRRSFRKWACLSGRLYSQKKDFAADLTTSCSQTAPCWLYCSAVKAPEMNCAQIQLFTALKLFFESHILDSKNGKGNKSVH